MAKPPRSVQVARLSPLSDAPELRRYLARLDAKDSVLRQKILKLKEFYKVQIDWMNVLAKLDLKPARGKQFIWTLEKLPVEDADGLNFRRAIFLELPEYCRKLIEQTMTAEYSLSLEKLFEIQHFTTYVAAQSALKKRRAEKR